MKLFFIIISFLYSLFSFSQITVNNTQSAQELVELLFNNFDCATISNFNVSGNNSFASFNKNGSNFPFDSGIVLSTGFTNHISGPNTSLSDDNLGTSNDADMANFFSDTFDTTVLEFDFVPVTNFMSFEYIFASEEYQEGNNNTCAYSDVFAFLIKADTDTNYTNIALVPNTNTPVKVTTVHPYISNSCQEINEAYFGSWNSQTDTNVPINFNGQTTILKAQSTVIAGTTYHIKLIISDHVNYQYDSAVFLKAGSFNIGTDLGVDLLRSNNNALCTGENITLDSGITSAISYTWFADTTFPYDTFTPVSTNQNYTVSQEGKYKVEVLLAGGCTSEGEIIVEFADLPIISDTELIGCNDNLSDFFIFNLTDANPIITNNNTDLTVVNYYKSNNAATNQTDEITNFDAYENTIQNETIFARIENPNGCFKIAKIKLKVFHNPKIENNTNIYYCLNTYPDTITLESGLFSNPNNINTYTWFFDNGIDPIIDLNSNTTNININQSGIYTVTIENNDGCAVSRTITVINSNTATITTVLVSETMYSTRVAITIEVNGEGDYQYAIDDAEFQDSPIFNNLLYGYHLITVQDKNGCFPNTQKEITILQYKKFFTPNNDNLNDTWNLEMPNTLLLHYNTVSNITIYDRYGKIMSVINPKSNGWNGFYNGKLALPQDFWFCVDLIDVNGKVTTKKGNFSLVR